MAHWVGKKRGLADAKSPSRETGLYTTSAKPLLLARVLGGQCRGRFDGLHYSPILTLQSLHLIPGPAECGTVTPGIWGLTVGPVKGYHSQVFARPSMKNSKK